MQEGTQIIPTPLGETIDIFEKYFKDKVPALEGLECFLTARHHDDYYNEYKEHLIYDIHEVGVPRGGRLREGVTQVGDNVFFAFCSGDEYPRYQFVLGFAPNKDALEPYLLHSGTEHAYIIDDYNFVPKPYHVKEPTALFLNDEIQDEFKSDITNFLKNEEIYKNLPLYKRGALLYGPPGNGKTSLITWAATLFDKVFIVPPPYACNAAARVIDELCAPDESKLVVLEDIDALEEHTEEMLNFVDGAYPLNKVYFVATTNYPERLHENITNRPSRFDLFLEIRRPKKEVRRELLKHWFPELEDEDLDHYASTSFGLNASYFQELYILKHTTDKSLGELIERCKSRVKLTKNKNYDDEVEEENSIGFGKRNARVERAVENPIRRR